MSVSRALRAAAVDIRPLRESRDFRWLWTGQLISVLGRQITTVAIPLQVYLLTDSALAVGLVSLARLPALVGTSLAAGVIADRVDRRLVLLLANVGLAGCSVSLAVLAANGHPPVAIIIVVAVLITVFSSFDQPARSATIPNIVSTQSLPAAITLQLGLFHLSSVGGPVAGGVAVSTLGLPGAYAIDAATYIVGIASILSLSPQPAKHLVVESPVRSLTSGLRFLASNRAILGCFVFDLDAMVLGLPRVLFPILALHLYHGGAVTLGLLYGAPSAGGVVAVVTAGWLGRVRRLGRVFILGEIGWGLAIACAGFTSQLWLALLFLALAGGADAAGVIGRTTIVQSQTPDHLRGRVNAAWSIVGGGGPYVGDFESAGLATLTSPQTSMVIGGVACAVVATILAPFFPSLWRYRSEEGSGTDEPAGVS